jgi:hypothetical protein
MRLFRLSICAALCAIARLVSTSRADFDMRGFAISFLTLARVALPVRFFAIFFIER